LCTETNRTKWDRRNEVNALLKLEEETKAQLYPHHKFIKITRVSEYAFDREKTILFFQMCTLTSKVILEMEKVEPTNQLPIF
jgi:hypothetical protein